MNWKILFKKVGSGFRQCEPAIAWINLLAVVAGGFFAFHEYQEHETEVRIGRALEYFQRIGGSPWAEKKEKIAEAWDSLFPRLEMLAKAQVSADKTEEQYVQLILSTVQADADLKRSVEALLDFYEGIAVCVQTRLCDKATSDTFLLTEGRAFIREFYPYICALREKWKDKTIGSHAEAYFLPGVARRRVTFSCASKRK